MKIIITESKLYNTIYKYFDKIYDVSSIDSNNPSNEWDDESEDDWEESENENIIEYFYETYDGEEYEFADDDGVVFTYIKKEYYPNDPIHQTFINKAPILTVYNYQGFTDDFGDYWKEPMKKWFEDKFGYPVNTILPE
jgi:hypothetical protein